VCNVSIRTTENFLPASAGTFHQIICRGSTIEYHMLHTTIMDDVAMDLHMNKMKNTRLIQRETPIGVSHLPNSRRMKGWG
jgi:hypothetical protein